ncbi:MAG: prephenate dehydrogenase/arogenate dehydrogenase family protein [Lachnospiraceae bacterium]|nr:prephenate dehydrogenase/arogenate dehydrogenase family protein [Lachnospiraceae bacterium]MBQ8846229.1 prephenate dehydrogenase/arogenate dehydrogenase family protein [Lachnospiraceae bacterium]
MDTQFGFIGLGLIGGSIARALRETDPSCKILAYSRKPALSEDLRSALDTKVLDNVVFSLTGLSDCDYIFLCAPVDSNISYLPELAKIVSKKTILTDVGSVKSGIHAAAEAAGLSAQFIGGHPMTGSERTGFSHSNALLMENAYYAITLTDACPKERVDAFLSLVKQIKSIPVVLSPAEHDDAVAAISHVPHVIAAQLVNLVRTSEDAETMRLLAAGGFKDITRIASSSPSLWESILSANTTFVLPTLHRYISLLTEAAQALLSENKEEIQAMFSEAGEFRSSLQERKGALPESFVLHADLRDEAGAIATFATLLAVHGISLKNIGIVHNRAYEQGALRIEFYDRDALERAYTLLTDNRFTVYR